MFNDETNVPTLVVGADHGVLNGNLSIVVIDVPDCCPPIEYPSEDEDDVAFSFLANDRLPAFDEVTGDVENGYENTTSENVDPV